MIGEEPPSDGNLGNRECSRIWLLEEPTGERTGDDLVRREALSAREGHAQHLEGERATGPGRRGGRDTAREIGGDDERAGADDDE
jgi:hypothetical protein